MNPTRRDVEQNAALEAIRELQAAHFNEDPEAADETGKFTITFRVTFDRSAAPTMIKVSSRIAKPLAEVIKTPAQSAESIKVDMRREETPQSGHLITERELSEHLHISLRHLINLRKAGLPFIQLGSSVRYDLAEVDAYLRRNRRLSSHIERKRRAADVRKRVRPTS